MASLSESDGSGQIVVLIAGQQAAQVYPAPRPRVLATADFNGDGKPDLAVGDNPNATSFITLFLNTGDGHFRQGERYAFASPEVLSLAAGDLNGDGKADLVFGGDYAMLGVLLGRGDGTFVPGPLAAVNGDRHAPRDCHWHHADHRARTWALPPYSGSSMGSSGKPSKTHRIGPSSSPSL